MSHPYEARILRVLDHIHDNPAGDLSLDALSDIAAMSRFHWHRVFRAATGETLAQTVRRMRMTRAAFELARGEADIPALARRVGYADATSFTRAFSEMFGQPPGAFRGRTEFRPQPPTLQEGVPLMLPVILRDEPARRLAAVPHRGSYFEINRAFEKLAALMAARGLFASAGKMVGVYYDDPSSVAAKALRSHAGCELGDAAPIDAPLEVVKLPAGPHAVLTFKGPYAGLPAAYDQLYGSWLPASGHVPADAPPFEVYLNSPMDTAPDDLLTEICLPLRA
jgi:AraC family transcriptional regulator